MQHIPDFDFSKIYSTDIDNLAQPQKGAVLEEEIKKTISTNLKKQQMEN
jgi:hypothetical protein